MFKYVGTRDIIPLLSIFFGILLFILLIIFLARDIHPADALGLPATIEILMFTFSIFLYEQRGETLAKVKKYLAPSYTCYWKNLRISNEKCSIYLGSDEKTIILTELIAPYRRRKIISGYFNAQKIWDSFCYNFNDETRFENILTLEILREANSIIKLPALNYTELLAEKEAIQKNSCERDTLQKFTNEYCEISLNNKKGKFILKEKIFPYRKCEATFKTYYSNNIGAHFCYHFKEDSTYDTIISDRIMNLADNVFELNTTDIKNTQNNLKEAEKKVRHTRRKQALEVAKQYLAPYNSIWNNLRLANNHCEVRLEKNGKEIIISEKVKPFRECKVAENQPDKIWDNFCYGFNHNKTYQDLITDCQKFGTYTVMVTPSQKNKQNRNRVDVNNCSEIELTNLPGISIVHAKKIIKKRTEIGGFKHINDFFAFINVKPHFEKQLEDIVFITKMQKPSFIKQHLERHIDL